DGDGQHRREDRAIDEKTRDHARPVSIDNGTRRQPVVIFLSPCLLVPLSPCLFVCPLAGQPDRNWAWRFAPGGSACPVEPAGERRQRPNHPPPVLPGHEGRPPRAVPW